VTPVVLIHGGMHGSWCWDPVLPFLTAETIAVDLPGRGSHPADLATVSLDDSVTAVLEDADRAGFDRFVLVGHSLGGVTITETAVRHPGRVAALVYVGALVPGPGESPASLLVGEPSVAMPVLPEELARSLFGTGMDDATWAAHYAQLTPDAPGLMNAVVSGYPSGMPITYVSMTLDQPVPPELAARMAANLGPTAEHRVVAEAGHTIMTTHPELIASIINESAAG
jgi:pimeloyl-ACP methyl ester carboxylesterase